MPEDQNKIDSAKIISSQEIDSCIAVLEQLVSDTNQLFNLSEDKRTALLLSLIHI